MQDAGEAGIAGVTIPLTGKDANGGDVDRLQTTAADGSYSFSSACRSGAAGYIITESQPAAYLDGKTTVPAGNPHGLRGLGRWRPMAATPSSAWSST